MQIGAANGGGGDFQNDVIRFLKDGIGYGIDFDIVTEMIDERAHAIFSL